MKNFKRIKKIDYKFFLINVFILLGIFSLFHISNTKVSAQTENKITVTTSGYSALSANEYVFGGYYDGNIEKKGFTTYFQFKKNDSNLDTGAEETIKIVRDSNVEEYNDFYTSPELNLFSTYYFRAVGYFNDNPNEKFYGNVLSLRTGYIPTGTAYPFFLDSNSLTNESLLFGVVTFEANSQINEISEAQISFLSAGGSDTDLVYTDVTFTRQSLEKALTTKNASSIVSEIKKLKSKINILKTSTTVLNSSSSDITTTPNTNTNTDTDNPSNTGLVPCDGSTEHPCGFEQVIELINTVISFIFKYLVIPLAAIMFAYAGVLLITSGGETSKREHAKHIFLNVAVGLILAAGAFLIVQTVLSIVGYDKSINWFGF